MELKKNIKAGKNSLKLNLIIFVYFSLFSFAFSQSNLEGTYTDIKILDKISSKNILLKLKNGDLVAFKDLSIKSLKCKNSEFDDNPEITAYLQVTDLNNTNNDHFPQKKTVYGNLVEVLRYGENPHQQAAIYSKNNNLDISQLSGKKLSYNNYNDIYSALNISRTLPKNNGTVIVKHANPCGVSILKNKLDSYKAALACDPISAFGGIISCNFKIDKKLALELNKIFLEVIVANGFEKNALKILKSKKNLRLIDASSFSQNEIFKFNSLNNSILIQSEDKKLFSKNDFKIVSKKKPTKIQFDNLIFAFNVCRYAKSNAIVLVDNKTTVGIGSGQPSRLDSCQIAIDKMNKFRNLETEIVAASDAFFPFVDGIEKLVQAGVSAVVQPSGSINDKEVVKFANATGTVLIFSKTRHFRH